MPDLFKTSGFITGILILIFFISCTKEEIKKERTLQDEMHELDSIIQKKAAEGFNIDTTDLGVYYILYEPGTGPYPQARDTCFLEYRAYFPDGTMFDASKVYESTGIWDFIYLYQDLPTGVNDGIALMNSGTEIELIIPSPLAFGDKGSVKVPPFTTVIYVAKMHEIKVRKAEKH